MQFAISKRGNTDAGGAMGTLVVAVRPGEEICPARISSKFEVIPSNVFTDSETDSFLS